MPASKGVPNTVTVVCQGLSQEEVADLADFLSVHDAIEESYGPTRGKRACKGGPVTEPATIDFTVKVVEFFVVYAGTKILDFLCDEVKEWMKRKRKKPEMIVLNLNGTKKRVGEAQKARRKREG